MNKRIFWSLVAAAALITGSVWTASAIAGSNDVGPGMMSGNGAGSGMMHGAPAATQNSPDAAGPCYHRMRPGTMGGHGGHGMGPGMMGGYGGNGMGPGMMGGYGGYDMGPGMMGGYGRHGMGPGMMGGYGGYGMGQGMMGGYGGYGMGLGMMAGYGANALDLSSEQRNKIADIWNSSVNKAWPVMGQLREQDFQFARLMAEENPDRAAVNKAYVRISELRKKLLDLRLDARQHMLGVLTEDQRKELQKGSHRHGQ